MATIRGTPKQILRRSELLQLNESSNEFKTRSPRRQREQARQVAPEASETLKTEPSLGASQEGSSQEVKVDKVQGHHDHMQSAAKNQSLPLDPVQLGAPLSTKKSKLWHWQREDCGRWALSDMLDVEGLGKERGKVCV